MGETVPNFGFGIIPFGPRTFPSFPTLDIMSGAAIKTSKSILPELIVSIKSSEPAISAPADLASSTLSLEQITAILIFFPLPFGKSTVVLKTLSGLVLSTAREKQTSNDSTNLAFDFSLITLTASSIFKELFLSKSFTKDRYLFDFFFSAISLLPVFPLILQNLR